MSLYRRFCSLLSWPLRRGGYISSGWAEKRGLRTTGLVFLASCSGLIAGNIFFLYQRIYLFPRRTFLVYLVRKAILPSTTS